MAKDPAFLFSQFESDGFPPYPGKSVYAVFVQNYHWFNGAPHLLYIGSSLNPDKRRSSSKHPYKIAWNRFKNHIVYFACFYSEDFREDEKILIDHFRPIFNKQHNGS